MFFRYIQITFGRIYFTVSHGEKPPTAYWPSYALVNTKRTSSNLFMISFFQLAHPSGLVSLTSTHFILYFGQYLRSSYMKIAAIFKLLF